jgi:hypothetical protein
MIADILFGMNPRGLVRKLVSGEALPIYGAIVASCFLVSGASPERTQGSLVSPTTSASTDTMAHEALFISENDVAMKRMMNGMSVKPTGDASRDFVEMMIPHHQGAIDMALAYLRTGENEQLRRIAQEIIVDQQQEIAAMRLAVGDPLPASSAVQTQAALQICSSPKVPEMRDLSRKESPMKMGD